MSTALQVRLGASTVTRHQLERCIAGEDIRSSDRARDEARQWLRRKGYIVFDRSIWRWLPTALGREALRLYSGASS